MAKQGSGWGGWGAQRKYVRCMPWLCCGQFREVASKGPLSVLLYCEFFVYDQISFSFSPVFP